jgi:CspA family cold shock protein
MFRLVACCGAPEQLAVRQGEEAGFFGFMGYDRGRRRGRDKRDRIGEDSFDPFVDSGAQGGAPSYQPNRFEDRDRFGEGRSAGQDRGGFGGGGGQGGARGGMPMQVVGASQGKVKFFNTNKGFGFIQRDDGGEDVFVHISQVERAGLDGLAEGQELAFNLVDRGGKISAADLQIVGEKLAAPVSDGPPQRELTGEKAVGTVKFFNAMKGFGFITRDDGGADAFVHISAVERSGLQGINEGDRFEFDLEVDRRGKYSAVNLVPVEG